MGVVYPTVTLGIGDLGIQIVDRLTASLDSEEPRLKVLRCQTSSQVGQELGGTLQDLLTAGKNTQHLSEPRLDILAFADGWRQTSDDLIRVCMEACNVVGNRFGTLFPANRAPNQRTAGLHFVIVVPPLTGDQALDILRRLRKLERWAQEQQTVYPLLSRIWVLSSHTRTGVLSKADTVASSAAFGISMIGSGLREEDTIVARMSHHNNTTDGLISFFSAASLDLPKARLRSYAAERALYDATSTLVARVEQSVDERVAVTSTANLGAEKWLEPFISGDAAQRCRQLAANLSGATTALPERIKVHPFDEAEDIRSRYAILFREATQVRDTTHADSASLDAMIVALDKAESASLRQMRAGMLSIFNKQLGPTTGLKELPQVTASLSRIRSQFMDEHAREKINDSQGPSDTDPLRTELEGALKVLPSRSMLAATAGTVGLTMGLLFMLTAFGITATELQIDVNYHPTTVKWLRVAIWLVSVLVSLLVGYLTARWVGARSRSTVRDALQQRRDAIHKLWMVGGGGQPGRQADAQLRQRRLRVRRSAIRLLENTLEHLEAIRHTLLDARDRSHQRLSELCPSPQPDPSLDDLEPLLGRPRPLHAALVTPDIANWWVRSCQQITSQQWPDRLLEGCWPKDGLEVDLPCASQEQLNELGRWQTTPLMERNLFGDPRGAEAAAATVAEFTARAPQALDLPIHPCDPNGEPIMGTRHGDMFVVAPREARATLSPIFEKSSVNLPGLWTEARAERILFIRTWEGFTVAQILKASTST